jgi:hypothetical protein
VASGMAKIEEIEKLEAQIKRKLLGVPRCVSNRMI